MNAAERMTHLRALLYEEPTAERWTQLMALFEDWDYRDSLHVGIDYAEGFMDRWPEALRVAPARWVQVLLGSPKHLVKRAWERGNRAHPAMALARTLDLRRKHHGLKVSGDKPIKHLTRAKALHAITSLLLDNMQIGDDGAYVLGQVPHLGSLRRLSVAHCGLGPQGVWDLTEGSGGLLDGLETLDISGNRFGDEGIRGLAVHPGLASLRTLIIGANDLSLAGMRMLALSPHLRALIDLDLSGLHHCKPEALRQLAEAEFAPQLQRLNLAFINIGHAHLRALPADRLAALETLDFSGLHWGDDNLDPLTDWLLGLDRLKTLLAHYVDERAARAIEIATEQIKEDRPDFTSHITRSQH